MPNNFSLSLARHCELANQSRGKDRFFLSAAQLLSIRLLPMVIFSCIVFAWIASQARNDGVLAFLYYRSYFLGGE
ncbi:MAG: hypothetical protein K0R48_247 [Gammaproteobacteria bacterium]|jgi:hypothetical protein|nr:hypothetical protein [Gammaproteobacteria bacterium]